MYRIFVAGIVISLLAAGCSSAPASGGLPAVQLEASPLSEDTGRLPPVSDLTGTEVPEVQAAPPALGGGSRNATGLPRNDSTRVKLGYEGMLYFGLNVKLPTYTPYAYSPEDWYMLNFRPEPDEHLGNGAPVAYRGYEFRIGDYKRSLDVHLGWDRFGPGPQAENVFVALANFENNSWAWFTSEDGAEFSVPFDERFVNSEQKVIAVVLLFNEDADLIWITVGGNVPPYAGLVTDGERTARGPVLFDCTLDTFDVDGEVVKYEFDFDDDGVFEVDNGDNPRLEWNFDLRGYYRVAMRATDDDGLSATTTVDIEPSFWHSEIVDAGYIVGLAVDSADTLHACIRDYPQYYYAVNAGNGWRRELIDEDFLGDRGFRDMALDREGRPTLLFTGAGNDKLIQRTRGGWELYPAPAIDFALSGYTRYFLAFDSSNLPHIAGGIDEPKELPGSPGAGSDGESKIARYWRFDGSEWLQELDLQSAYRILGMGLDQSDTPYIGLNYFDEAGEFSGHVALHYDRDSQSWVWETITEQPVGHSEMVVGGDGAVHLVSPWTDGYFYRDAEGWHDGPDPGFETEGSCDILLDDAGIPQLVISDIGATMYCVPNDYGWDWETIKSGGLGQLGSAHMVITSDGTIHVFGYFHLEDERYQHIYPRPASWGREMHFWKLKY